MNAREKKKTNAAIDYFNNESKRMQELIITEKYLIQPAVVAKMVGMTPPGVEKRMREGQIRWFTVFGKKYLSGLEVDHWLHHSRQMMDNEKDTTKYEQMCLRRIPDNAAEVKKAALKCNAARPNFLPRESAENLHSELLQTS